MPMTYVISSHGQVDYEGTTTIPANVKVFFYQNFGVPIANPTAMAIQSALCTTLTETTASLADQVLRANPPRTMWQSPGYAIEQRNDIVLTPDTRRPRAFNSGIVRALDNAVILDIDATGRMSLTRALAAIEYDMRPYGADRAEVHCLFCT